MKDIESILKYMEAALSFLGINILIEFRSLTLFQKVYRAFVCFTMLLYFFEFVFTFYHNSHNVEATPTGDQIILGLSVVGIPAIIIRGVILLNKRDELLVLTNWMRDVHQITEDHELIEKCTDQSFDNKPKQDLVKAWK